MTEPLRHAGSSPEPVRRLDPDAAQRVASHPRTSVWVSASAGSGKTKVLADRVIRLLLDGVEPQKILCLTFTRAAAAEMAIRLTRQLARWATCDEQELRKDLDALQSPAAPDPKQMDAARRLFAKTLATPGGMRISTLHAFGQEVLRRFPLEAGVQPHFVALEENEAQALAEEARGSLLHDAARDASSPEGRALRLLTARLNQDSFTDALEAYLGRPERFLRALRLAGGREALGRKLRAELDLEPDDTRTGLLARLCANDAMDAEALLRTARAIMARGSSTFTKRVEPMLTFLQAGIEERIALYPKYRRAFLTGEGEAYKSFANKEIVKDHPDLEDTMRAEALRVLQIDERLDTLRVAEESEALLVLASAFVERFTARKTERAALDFSDLIRKTVDLLERPGTAEWVLYKLDGGIDHILLDEAQDTSPEQWRIVGALSEAFFAGSGARADVNRTLFVVGDEKQSIYSFQGADPVLFDRMRATFRQRIADAERLYQEVDMTISFRSAPAILRLVDETFADDAARRGVSAVPVRHDAFHADVPGRVEVWPLEEPAEKEGEEADWTIPETYAERDWPPERLAHKIAQRVKGWIQNKLPVYDRSLKIMRPVTPGDVMVLVPGRRGGDFIGPLNRELKKAGVAVMGVDRMRLMEELSVMDVAALLAFMLLPEDDLNLATVLRGPLLGLSEDDLMTLALGREGSLWQALNSKAETYPEACAYLRRALDRADRDTPYATVARILAEPCPADAQSGRRALWKRLGAESQDPLDELLEAAQAFGARHAPSLQAFLHWLTASDSDIKRESDQQAEQVRIMTAHAAKGLEAPIVILPDSTAPPGAGKIPKLLWHEEIPFFVTRAPLHARLRALRDAASERMLEEYRRLLYVALTRAGERLIVAGWKGKQEVKEDSWYTLVRAAMNRLHQDWCVSEEEGSLIYEDPGYEKRKLGEETRAPLPPEEEALPAWALISAAQEPVPPRPLIPSKPDDEPAFLSPNETAFQRGRIVHTLLQNLPDLAPEKQEEAARRFLANPQNALEESDQRLLFNEVFKLLRESAIAPIFGPGSRAEVPVVGLIEGRMVSGRVDRLCVRGDEVWVIDYKTNRPPPEKEADVPEVYRRQLASYRAVLERIYTGKRIRCFLVWTLTSRLMELAAP